MGQKAMLGALRLCAGAAWLVLALGFFAQPLSFLVGGAEDALDFGSADDAAAALAETVGPAPDRGMVVHAKASPGGNLYVNGEDQGAVPLLINIRCRQDETVFFRISRQGFQDWERDAPCNEGQMLRLQARLRR